MFRLCLNSKNYFIKVSSAKRSWGKINDIKLFVCLLLLPLQCQTVLSSNTYHQKKQLEINLWKPCCDKLMRQGILESMTCLQWWQKDPIFTLPASFAGITNLFILHSKAQSHLRRLISHQELIKNSLKVKYSLSKNVTPSDKLSWNMEHGQLTK